MTPNLLDELEKIVALSEKATPGKVELHTSCSWRRIVAERGRPFLVPTIDPDRHQNMDTTESAEFVVALVNWFRTNAPALADMAKRMEAAERDAAYGRALREAMEAEYQAAKESRKGGKQEAWITTYTLLRRLKVAADHLSDQAIHNSAREG